MKKTVPILVIIGLLAAGTLLLLRPKPEVAVVLEPAGPQVCFGNACYGVELVRTQAELEKGLMYRTSLAPGAGMLFIFDKDGDYPFWMKNTLIPLDIVWINSDYKAAYIKRGAQPCARDVCPSIDPQVSARWVLEVNAGQMDGIGAKIGDIVVIKNFR
jgi:uncharacterized membrane protein (UPF0127 family)